MSAPYYYYYFVFIWIARSLDHHFGLELHFVVFGPLSHCVVFSWSFFIIFVILLAVSLRSVWSLHNIYISLIYICCVVCMDSFTFIKYFWICFDFIECFTTIFLRAHSWHIHQVYVLVFQLVCRIYGRLRCCPSKHDDTGLLPKGTVLVPYLPYTGIRYQNVTGPFEVIVIQIKG